jgi:hypothetical protein
MGGSHNLTLGAPSPPKDADEEEQPYHIHKVPIEESRLKPQVMISHKMRTRETGGGNGQREGSQSYVEAMKTGCQMKRGPERAIPTLQGGGEILHRLDGGKE